MSNNWFAPNPMDGILGKKISSVRIGNHFVGEGYPAYLIGEIGLNHAGKLDKAIELIDIAVEAGLDAVKFQKRTLNKIYRQDLLDDPNTYEEGFRYLIPILKETEFGREQYDQLYAHCQKRGIDFLCTPFDEEAVDFLAPYNLPAFKVASGDMHNLILLEKIIGTGKPLIISTGMATFEDIDRIGNFLRRWDVECILLHAVSAYPTPVGDTQLNVIKELKARYGVPVGLSSHEFGFEISAISIAAGACLIERHITLDKREEGPDHSSSLEPEELKEMVRRVRFIEEAMGSPRKKLSRIVIRNQETLSKSLVASRDISIGEPILRSMISAKGPGKGLSPVHLYDLIGKIARRAVPKDNFFLNSDIEEHVELSNYVPNFDSIWGLKGRFFDLDVYNERYNPKFVEIHLNDKDLDYPFEEMHAGCHYPFEIYLHYPTYWHRSVVNLASENMEERMQHINVVQRVIDLARRIAPYFTGTPKVVVHMGGMDLKPIPDNRHLIELGYDSMRKLNTEGVVFLAENNPPRPWYFSGQWYDNAFCHPQEMIDFCTEFNLPMCFDFSHAKLFCNVTGYDFYEYVRQVAPITKHLHVCDAYGIDGEGMQIGEGEIDMKETIKILAEYGDLSTMSWTPEIWQGHNHDYHGFLLGFSRLINIPELKAEV
jgi:N-acetylneuraminate synthase